MKKQQRAWEKYPNLRPNMTSDADEMDREARKVKEREFEKATESEREMLEYAARVREERKVDMELTKPDARSEGARWI